MAWIEIIKELLEALTGAANTVIAGALEPTDYVADGGVIFIIRDGESTRSIKRMSFDNVGTVTIFIENWIRDDSTDVLNGYQQLADQEGKVLAALKGWLENRNSTAFSILSADVTDIVSDGDMKRPLVGSRMTLEVTYSE